MLTKYKKEDNANHVKLYNKWVYGTGKYPEDTPISELYKQGAPNILDFSKHKKKVVIYTGPAWEPWDRKAVDAGMAGSETWAAYLPIEFVKKGYETIVYNDLKVSDKKDSVLDPVYDDSGNKVGDVIYRDHTQMMGDLKYAYIDYFICSRTVEPFRQSLHSGKNYVMIHDVWINGDKNYDIMTWKVQKYAYLSDWHKDFLIQHHSMPSDKMFLTANGVDFSLYEDVDKYEKKNQMVYSSSPDRGLYQLLQMFPRIRAQVPDFTLKVAYGFFNWEAAANKRNDVLSMNLIKKIKELMNQPGVEYLDRVDKKTLAGHQMESKIWGYPVWFAETFCIGAVENGLSKNAILTTSIAGIETTARDAAIMLPANGLSRDGDYPQSYQDSFVEEAVKLLKNDSHRSGWVDKAYSKMKEYSWKNIADKWIEIFNEK